MGARALAPRLKTHLDLGRVSNLPTVVANTVAAGLLAGGSSSGTAWLLVVTGGALAYTAGMYLNDAFDRDFDRKFQTWRPIPSGRINARSVFAIGFGLLALAGSCFLGAQTLALQGLDFVATSATLALIFAILAYDSHHKENAWAPLVMGLCRGWLYLAAGLSLTATPTEGLLTGAAVVTGYVTLLTLYARRTKSPVRIAALIAALPIVDAFILIEHNHAIGALLILPASPLTLKLQAWVRGT